MRIPTETSRLSLACLCPQTPHKSLASTSGTTAPNSSLARLKIMLTGTSPSVPEHPSFPCSALEQLPQKTSPFSLYTNTQTKQALIACRTSGESRPVPCRRRRSSESPQWVKPTMTDFSKFTIKAASPSAINTISHPSKWILPVTTLSLPFRNPPQPETSKKMHLASKFFLKNSPTDRT